MTESDFRFDVTFSGRGHDVIVQKSAAMWQVYAADR